jgi:hypothetical protein
MTATPDTTHTDLDHKEALFGVIANYTRDQPYPDNASQEMFEDLEPVLAAIRRQAAADALTEQARHLDGRARFWRDLQRSHEAKGRPESADPYRHYADQAHRTADYLRKEAQGIIAEGYEFECQECDTPVPDAGDLCEQHDVDDENPWAE